MNFDLAVKNISDARGLDVSAEDVGKLLFAQGALMQQIGLEMLKEAATAGSARKSSTAIAALAGAEKALTKSAEYLLERSKLEERKELLKVAADNGYFVAFEVDGRVSLECEGRNGRITFESV